MKIVTYHSQNELKLGILHGENIIDLTTASQALGINDFPDTPTAFYQHGTDALASVQLVVDRVGDLPDDCVVPYADAKLGPCVPYAGKIVCVGLNYRRHAEEARMAIPTEPVLFSKYNNTIAAHQTSVALPSVGVEYDYEAELAFVIGKRAKNVPLDDALDYVLGYCNVNDVSARDLQLRTGQWLIGKNLDDFLPIGPYLLTADELSDPQNLSIRAWRNGDLVQDSNTSDMIFTVAEIIAHISTLMTLEAGDLITTGTPEGVIFGKEHKDWLTEGDEVTIEVEGLGKLSNTFSQVD